METMKRKTKVATVRMEWKGRGEAVPCAQRGWQAQAAQRSGAGSGEHRAGSTEGAARRP